MKFAHKWISVLAAFFLLTACGGGGDAGPENGDGETPLPSDVTYGRLLLHVEGSAGPSEVGGVQFELILATGVSLPTDSEGNVLQETVSLSTHLTGGLIAANYLPPIGNLPAELNLGWINDKGFGPGEVIRVDFESIGSILPEEAEFTLVYFEAVDGAEANVLPGLSGSLRVEQR